MRPCFCCSCRRPCYVSMVTRTPIILDVIRDRNSLYRELPDEQIENIYTIKINQPEQ